MTGCFFYAFYGLIQGRTDMKNFRFFIKVATIGTAVTVFGIGTAVALKYQVTYELVNKVHNVVSV